MSTSPETDGRSPPGRRALVALVGLLALAAWSRGATLSQWWLNADEGIYYLAATASYQSYVDLVYYNAHPPLYYLLLRGLAAISTDLGFLRLPAFLFGVLGVGAGFLLGRELASDPRRADALGLLVAFGLCIGPAVVGQGQLLRPYAMIIFLLTAAAWSLTRYLRAGRGRDLLGFSVLLTVAMATHYCAAIFLAASACVVAVLGHRGRPAARRYRWLLAAYAPPLLTFAAAVHYHLLPYLLWTRMDTSLAARLAPRGLADALALLGPAWTDAFCLVVEDGPSRFPAAALALTGLWLARSRRAPVAWAWMVGVALSATAAYLTGRFPLEASRRCVWMAPFLLAPLGDGLLWFLENSSRGARRAAVVAALLMWGEPTWMTATLRIPARFAWEYQVTQRDLRACEAYLEGLAAPTPLVLSMNLRYLLAPFLRPDGSQRPEASGGVAQIQPMTWGERRALYLFRWSVDLDAYEREHLQALRDIAATTSGAGEGEPAEALFMLSQEGVERAWLERARLRGPSQGILGVTSFGAMHLVHLDLTALLRWRAARPADRPQE